MTSPALPLTSIPSLRRTILSLGSVMSGEALIRVATLCAAILIARLYGPRVFGIYAAALAYSTIAWMLADNGLQWSAIQQLSSHYDQRDELASSLYVSKAVLLGLASFLLVATAWVMRIGPEMKWIGALVALRTQLQSYSQLNASMLKALDLAGKIAVAQTIHFLLLIGVFVLLYLRSYSILILLILMVVGQGLELALSGAFLWSSGVRPVHVRLRQCWGLIRNATPLGITFGMAGAGIRLDVVLLSWLAPLSSVGQFAAAQSVFVTIMVLSWLFGSVLLATMGRIAHDRTALNDYTLRWVRILLIVILPVLPLILWLSPRVLGLVLGSKFEGIATIVSLLVAATPLLFLNSLFLNRAIALRQRHLFTAAQASALAIGVLSAILFAPRFGGLGIAFAALLREITLFAFLLSTSFLREWSFA